jgi:hypothetical protein
LGHSDEGTASAIGRQSSQLAPPLFQPVLGPGGGCHGESTTSRGSTVPTTHPLRMCSCQLNNRTCVCFSNDSPNGRYSTPMESAKSSYPIPTPSIIQTEIETISEQNDAEALGNLTSIISLESSLLFLPFQVRDPTQTVIEIHQRVQSFRLSLDLIPNVSPHLLFYRVVVNPQTRDTQETFREHCHRENHQRRRSQG